ncbi:MAG: hypothetical protein AB1347_08255, partial [Acidobacteriota bacterium]
LLERSKLENVVTRREDCRVEYCKDSDACPLDKGAPACPVASVDGRLMLDPYWLGGSAHHARRTSLRLCVLLAKDPVLPGLKDLEPRDAARMLADGSLPGHPGLGPSLLNPHLRGLFDAGRVDQIRARHEGLFALCRTVLLNTSVGSPEAQARLLLDALSRA